MKKDLAVIFGLFLLVAVLLIFGKSFSTVSFLTEHPASSSAALKDKNTVAVTIKDLKLNAVAAASPDTRKNGLSKKNALPLDSAMLFVFDHPDKYGIWMKNMKFAIDIIWIDSNKNIVAIANEIPPQPGKKDKDLIIYKPSVDALYVLEINAGLVKLHNIAVGDAVQF